MMMRSAKAGRHTDKRKQASKKACGKVVYSNKEKMKDAILSLPTSIGLRSSVGAGHLDSFGQRVIVKAQRRGNNESCDGALRSFGLLLWLRLYCGSDAMPVKFETSGESSWICCTSCKLGVRPNRCNLSRGTLDLTA